MTDQRIGEHARFIVNKSTKIGENDTVVIHIDDDGMDLATEIFKECAKLGAHPVIMALPSEALRVQVNEMPNNMLESTPKHLFSLISSSDVYIHVRSETNLRSLADTALTKMDSYSRGQHQRMEKLAAIMKNTDKVRLVGDKTDLEFSIKGRVPIISDPIHNVPSGEVFTAPLDNSANGEVYFDLPAIRLGREVKGVHFKFRNGQIIDMSAEQNEDFLRSQLSIDAGAKRLGEFGIGMNLKINRFTKNILFDEKISGTIHLA